jgi:pyridoxamine 5'-phosphate oxidase
MEHASNIISQIREEFIKGSLSENDVEILPDAQFNKWMQQGIDAKINEVQAFNLCTVSVENKPSNRIVYLREFGNNKYYFYTNYQSKKGIDIAHNNNVSMCFFYPELERQIRIEGTITFAEIEKSDNYFGSRPRESQIGAWSSPQSKKINTRNELENILDNNTSKFDKEIIQRPNFWGGYIINANYYEFWQGRRSRLHDRICYELKNNKWEIYRIAP